MPIFSSPFNGVRDRAYVAVDGVSVLFELCISALTGDGVTLTNVALDASVTSPVQPVSLGSDLAG